jgi:hypothetical protein
MQPLIQGILIHGPWAAFALLLLIVYTRLVNDVIAVTRKDAEAFAANTKAIEQITHVMVEVKDTIHKCRKVDP